MPSKPINAYTVALMLSFTILVLFLSGSLEFPTLATSVRSARGTTGLSEAAAPAPDPFTDLVGAFKKWDSRVGCARFRERLGGQLGNGFNGSSSPSSSLQVGGGGESECRELQLSHVSVLVKGWTWIPDNLDNLYPCRCGLSCSWTKSPVLADKPDALLFETSTPPLLRRNGDPLRVYMDLEAGRRRSGREDVFISYHAKDDVQSTYAGSLFHNGRNYHVSSYKDNETLVYWSSSRCLPQRNELAKRLLKLLPHHSFGKCLNNVGGRDKALSFYPEFEAKEQHIHLPFFPIFREQHRRLFPVLGFVGSARASEREREMGKESPFRGDIVKGKVALITGGGSGIGFEISTQLGKHGACVAVMGRRKPVLDSAVSALASLGVPAVGFECDVRRQDDAKRVVESTFRHFGRLDILINAAAGNFLVSPEDLSPNGFRTVMDIDSVGTFTMCHEALKYLKKGGPGRGSSGGGTILNISATLHYTASWYQIHVSAAKAAVDAVTRNLALEWGTDYDIRVNGIAPGPIGDTPGMSKLVPPEIGSKARDYMPLYRLGETWDIAMAALYLASDAGKFVNGTTLIVDGGLWLSRPRHLPKEAVKQLSRAVEKRSRDAPVAVPKSKL